MKKATILILVLTCGLCNATVWFAQNSSVNINSANEWNDVANGSGNFLTWASLAVGDVLVANGKTAIAINVDVTCLKLSTSNSDGGTAGGGFTVTSSVTVTANILAGTTPCIVSTGTGYTWNVAGAVTAGTANYAYGIDHSCTTTSGILSVTVGPITGGSAVSAHGIRNNSTGVVNFDCAVIGGPSGTANYGILNNSTGNITGNTGPVTGGGGTSNYGLSKGSGGAVVLNCNIIGGSTAGSFGIYNAVTTGSLTVAGDIEYSLTKTSPMAGFSIIYTPVATNKIIAPSGAATTKDYFYDIPDAGNVTEDDYVAGVQGTYKEPTEAQVQDGVYFGALSVLLGTYVGEGSSGNGGSIMVTED